MHEGEVQERSQHRVEMAQQLGEPDMARVKVHAGYDGLAPCR